MNQQIENSPRIGFRFGGFERKLMEYTMKVEMRVYVKADNPIEGALKVMNIVRSALEDKVPMTIDTVSIDPERGEQWC